MQVVLQSVTGEGEFCLETLWPPIVVKFWHEQFILIFLMFLHIIISSAFLHKHPCYALEAKSTLCEAFNFGICPSCLRTLPITLNAHALWDNDRTLLDVQGRDYWKVSTGNHRWEGQCHFVVKYACCSNHLVAGSFVWQGFGRGGDRREGSWYLESSSRCTFRWICNQEGLVGHQWLTLLCKGWLL